MKKYINSLLVIGVIVLICNYCNVSYENKFRNTAWYFFDKDSSYFEVFYLDTTMILCETLTGNCMCYKYNMINDSTISIRGKIKSNIIVNLLSVDKVLVTDIENSYIMTLLPDIVQPPECEDIGVFFDESFAYEVYLRSQYYRK